MSIHPNVSVKGKRSEGQVIDFFVKRSICPRDLLSTSRRCKSFTTGRCGDSMEDANLYDGDRVLVLMKQRFRDGDIVVARIGDGYTVKCYYEDDEGKHWLVAQNKEKEEEYRSLWPGIASPWNP